MSAASTFTLRIDEIWTIPGRPFPVVWGTKDGGDVFVGACIEAESADGTLAQGIVEAVEQHGGTAEPDGRRVGIMISGPAAAFARQGDILRGCA